MRSVVLAITIGLLVTLAVFGCARALAAAADCDQKREACRAACVDRHKADANALAACRDECNRAWLACGKR